MVIVQSKFVACEYLIKYSIKHSIVKYCTALLRQMSSHANIEWFPDDVTLSYFWTGEVDWMMTDVSEQRAPVSIVPSHWAAGGGVHLSTLTGWMNVGCCKFPQLL